MIEILKVVKKFNQNKSAGGGNEGNVVGLKETSLKVKKGEFLAIEGPSGSGKSTLLNIISGLDIPSSGQVLIEDKRITNYSDNELSKYRNEKIGFIFQEFHLEQSLNVLDNVLLPKYFDKKTEEDEELAKKLIREVGLSKKIHSKIGELSGGQKQRVAIARALINQPKIIIADEPTGNLDDKTGATIIQLLKKLHKDHNTTLIIATHDSHISQAADRVFKIS